MCTLEHHGNIFILTLTGTTADDEHRLNPTVMSSLLSTLHRASSLSSPGSILITTSSGKFFSNGFDLNYVQSTPSPQKAFQEMIPAFKLVIAALIDLPMPTVAAVNGHASAAGLFLAIAHDYVIIDCRRGFMYMSEVDIGLTLPDFCEELLREKLGRKGLRDTGLWGRRLKGDEAVEMGVVDVAVREGGEAEVRLYHTSKLLKKFKNYILNYIN